MKAISINLLLITLVFCQNETIILSDTAAINSGEAILTDGTISGFVSDTTRILIIQPQVIEWRIPIIYASGNIERGKPNYIRSLSWQNGYRVYHDGELEIYSEDWELLYHCFWCDVSGFYIETKIDTLR